MEKKDEAKEAWLNSQKKSTAATYRIHWNKFQNFTGLSGDQILEQRKNDKEFYWETKVLEFKNILTGAPWNLSSNSATAAAQTVRSFFAFHRMPLVFQRRETRKLGEHVRKYEDYLFSLADLSKMDEVADLQERYVLRLGKSFGLRAGDFRAIARGDIEPYIQNEIPISIGTFTTQKKGVVAYPFIDSDAQPVVKLMLEKMTREGRTKQTDRILEFKQNLELTRILRRLVRKAGINVGTKTVRFHCLRKFLCDHLSSHMAESKWKQVIGKKITEGAYISPDELAKDYRRAMDETCFKRATVDFEARQQAVERIMSKFMANEPLDERDRHDIEHWKIMLRTKIKPDECKDGSHCQKIVSEEELAKFLDEGWNVKAVLPSGKVVISND